MSSLLNISFDCRLMRLVHLRYDGASIKNNRFTDLVFSDDSVILFQSLEIVVFAFQELHEKAKPLALQVSWSKTKVTGICKFKLTLVVDIKISEDFT